MQRIRTVLQKLTELAQRNPDRTIIDVDLMLDYTRVIYADLLEMRAGMVPKQSININEPTLDEMTKAMETAEETVAVTFPEPVAAPRQPEIMVPQPVKEIPVAAPPVQTHQSPVQPEPVREKPLAPLPVLPATKPGKDIRRFIDLNDKYLFLSELFNNDLRAYEETMTQLSSCESKQSALQLLGAKFTDEGNSAHNGFQQMLDRFFE